MMTIVKQIVRSFIKTGQTVFLSHLWSQKKIVLEQQTRSKREKSGRRRYTLLYSTTKINLFFYNFSFGSSFERRNLFDDIDFFFRIQMRNCIGIVSLKRKRTGRLGIDRKDCNSHPCIESENIRFTKLRGNIFFEKLCILRTYFEIDLVSHITKNRFGKIHTSS